MFKIVNCLIFERQRSFLEVKVLCGKPKKEKMLCGPSKDLSCATHQNHSPVCKIQIFLVLRTHHTTHACYGSAPRNHSSSEVITILSTQVTLGTLSLSFLPGVLLLRLRGFLSSEQTQIQLTCFMGSNLID